MRHIIIVLVCICFTCFACTKKINPDKNLVYQTLNDIIQQDSLFTRVVCSKFVHPEIPEDIMMEFFKNDRQFIQQQISNTSELSVDTGRLYSYSHKKQGLQKTFIDTTCSLNIFYRLDYPVFSKDLQTVVIGITEDCNCFLGGQGYKAIYKRQQGRWTLIKKYNQWIS